jgi:hypothetical protein
MTGRRESMSSRPAPRRNNSEAKCSVRGWARRARCARSRAGAESTAYEEHAFVAQWGERAAELHQVLRIQCRDRVLQNGDVRVGVHLGPGGRQTVHDSPHLISCATSGAHGVTVLLYDGFAVTHLMVDSERAHRSKEASGWRTWSVSYVSGESARVRDGRTARRGGVCSPYGCGVGGRGRHTSVHPARG